jgi:phosphatidylserine/phosphatidylglycerophosphate/cardiolipin synthase-like enzyme
MRLSAVLFTAALSFSLIPAAFAAPDAVVGFSPKIGAQSAQDVVIDAISHAKHSIVMAAYSFTSKPIATALVDAKGRGVDVRLVADKRGNSGKYSATTFVANKNVPVRLNGKYAIMHNKFMVIDGTDVETGSFNYTQAAATKNAENALLLRGVPDLAASYTQDFEKLWSEGETLAPAY